MPLSKKGINRFILVTEKQTLSANDAASALSAQLQTSLPPILRGAERVKKLPSLFFCRR
jgi:hypothetical protein